MAGSVAAHRLGVAGWLVCRALRWLGGRLGQIERTGLTAGSQDQTKR